MASDVLQQLQHSRHLPLGEQIDLQVEMTALVGLPRQSILAGEDEQCQEDRLERDRRRQQREREGIERPNSPDCAGVYGDPRTEPEEMKNEDRTATGGAGDPVADLLRLRTRQQDGLSHRLIA